MILVSSAGIFSACKDSRQNLGLESEVKEIELVLGDTASETAEVDVSINNFSKNISGLMGFEVIGESAKVVEVDTQKDKSTSTCKLVAIRSGNSTLKATLYDGGASLEIPIRVEQKLVSISAKQDARPYIVKGAGRVVFDPEELLNFNPISTTQKAVNFKIGDEISNGFEAAIGDQRSSVEVVATSQENENIRTTFSLRLIDPVQRHNITVNSVQTTDVRLAVNDAARNTATVEVVIESDEEKMECFNSIYSDDNYTIKLISDTHQNGIHTFRFEVSALAGGYEGKHTLRFGVSKEFEYEVAYDINISTVVVAKSIAINQKTSEYDMLRVFNYNTTASRGTLLNFVVLPNNANSSSRKGVVNYNKEYITIYNSSKELIEPGTLIASDSNLYVKGNPGVVLQTEITFEVGGIEGLSDPLSAVIYVSIHEGAKEITGEDKITLTLNTDGTASDNIYCYNFNVVPQGAYSGEVWLEQSSSIIAVEQDANNSSIISVRALSSGVATFSIMLGNGVTKTVQVEVICPMDENSLILDVPSSFESEFVGQKTPAVVSRNVKLEKVVIQKSTAYEKAVPLQYTYYPQNASNVNYNYTVTKIEGEKDVIVEVVGSSIVGKNEGKARVDVVVSYDAYVEGEKQIKTQEFSFEVEVYIAVSSFFFSETTITVADINTVGFYKLSEATKLLQSTIYPTNATNKKIEYSLLGGTGDEVLENAYIKFDTTTGLITGSLAAGITPNPSVITAKLVDYTREYVVSIMVDVTRFERVQSIVVDNVNLPSGSITLSAGNPTFRILAHAEKISAYNKTLVYTFIPKNELSQGVVKVDSEGLVTLDVDKANHDGLGGFIRVAAQDSFKNDNINAETYVDIPVHIAIGTKESPYPISTASELLAINTPEALAKYYKIVGVIDLKNQSISPLGKLTGGIAGEATSKIVGINITTAVEGCVGLFTEIDQNAVIENVGFSGSINYDGDAQNIGLVAAINNGQINNCSISISQSQITTQASSNVGGVVGTNNGTIKNEIKQGTFNHSLLTSTGVMNVINSSTQEVVVGGVVGTNNGTIARRVEGLSLFGNVGYTAGVNIVATNASKAARIYAAGGIVGVNTGNCYNLAVFGTINAQDQTGGFVGINSGVISKAPDDQSNIARSLSNTFVVGRNNVGGFVGKTEGGTITSSGVELYEQATYLEIEKYIADAKGYVGGFVGHAYSGAINDCWVASFRTDLNAVVKMNSSNPTDMASAFAGRSNITANNWSSNILASSTNLGGVDETQYTAEFQDLPVVPTTVTMTALKNEMLPATEETLEFKVIYVDYFKSKTAEDASSLNKINLSEYIEHNLVDASSQISSADTSIIRVDDDGLQILTRGLCELTITSRFNPNLRATIYVWVVGYNEKMELSSQIEGVDYSIQEDSVMLFRVGEVSTFNKNNVPVVYEGISLVEGSPYTITTDVPYFDIQNFEQSVAIKTVDNILTAFPEETGLLDGFLPVQIGANYSVNIAGRVFSSDAFVSMPVQARILAGITDLKLSSTHIQMSADDTAQIGFSFVSALGNEEKLYIECDKQVYINKKLYNAGEKVQVNNNNTSGEFSIELLNKEFQGTLTVVFSDMHKTYSKYIQIEVLAQNVSVISTRYFDYLPPDPNRANNTTLMTPGKTGLLMLDVVPRQADIDYITITSDPTNAARVQFDFVDSNYARISGSTLVENGIKIPAILFKNAEGKFTTIHLKTIVTSTVGDNIPLVVRVTASDGYETTMTLVTKHTEIVEGSIEGKSGKEVDLAKGLTYTLNINSVGFSSNQVKIISSNNNVVEITQTEDFKYLIHVVSDFTSLTNTVLRIYGEKEVDGSIVRSSETTITINVKDYVINGINVKDSVDLGDYDLVLAFVGVQKIIEVEFINGVNCEFDINNTDVVTQIKNLENTINQILRNKLINEENDLLKLKEMFLLKDAGILEIYPQKPMTDKEGAPEYQLKSSDYEFEFEIEIEAITYRRTLRIEVEQISTSSSMIPITTPEEFMAMTEGNYYLLANDIDLSKVTFTPITAAIAGFDGNNKKITMPNYENQEQGAVNFGLFAEIKEGAIVQNIHLWFENFTTSITASDVNFGFIAAVNSGVITNCFVEGGTSARVVLSESATLAGIKRVGGIVGENIGYITNSRVQIPIFSAFGNVAGIACLNSGVISSCYVKNSTIINNSTFSDAMTAGIVCQNANEAQIIGSYIEGGAKDEDEINCNDLVSLRANSRIGAFVFANAGTIQDSFANIHVRSGSVASGFVYENQITGTILNCFSLSLMQANMSNNFSFVAIDPSGVIETTAGKFDACYFSSEINTWSVQSQKIQGITAIKNADFANEQTFTTYGLSSILAQEKGVWTLIGDYGSKLQYPKLLSANNLIKTDKELIRQDIDVNGAITYHYSNMPNGTSTNPYIVSSAMEFEQNLLKSTLNNESSAYVRLVSNINYKDEITGKELSELYKIRFCGEIDGNGLEISGFVINSEQKLDGAGLFASVGTSAKVGVVKNVVLVPEQINVPNASKVGALAGTLLGSGVYNVHVESPNSISPINLKGIYFVGGIVGHMKNSPIFISQVINSSANININATALNQTDDEAMKSNTGIYIPDQAIVNINLTSVAGGLIGYMESGTVAFSNASAKVVMGQVAGGLVGYMTRIAEVSNSFVALSDDGYIRSSFVAGGAVGYNMGIIKDVSVNSTASNYMRNGSVAPMIAGGVVGINEGDLDWTKSDYSEVAFDIVNEEIDYVGGVVGLFKLGLIKGYKFTGNLRGKRAVGGIVGDLSHAAGTLKIQNCYVGGDEPSHIEVYGIADNSVGALAGSNTKKFVIDYANLISPNVTFSRNWLLGEDNERIENKTYEEICDSDLGFFVSNYLELDTSLKQ